ncbi:methanogenesis marker 9 domain-containing protein [Methanosphaerula palustris]|uniref:Methanogenesis marker protein 9 n=1 Tax=Methanosphaerula palustris (strain ATCC BAA-1556 / DSM 19958 / E1-9c) TaxID=521011 RepID=B8GFK2_METPE|nr:methanogenesis marker 9 domain-containing protein [Methanosphaerula palustris]ACL16050.1 methanogenesis marker protein 9 [Methanosphaerula palustris E1-9c]
MSEQYERFELLINDQVVKTPVALASMAGMVDGAYAAARAAHVGVAFLGGFSIDKPTMEASERLVAQGRAEFIYLDPVEALTEELELLEGSDLVIGLNLRGSTPEAFTRIAEAFGTRVIYEVDAHCRQPEMMEAGAGQYLLEHPDKLDAIIRALKSAGVVVSVKIRAGVVLDDRVLAKRLWKAGADILHVDLMDYGYSKLRQIRNSCPLMLIANNSITSFDRMRDMFTHGADLVSLARQADERTLAGLDAAITRYADEEGWYNSPKQLCRGGDIRALTFCCMPVKDCPLLPMLEKIGMTRDDYRQFKEQAVEKTPLKEGEHTCFGSLAWCCKSSSPCMFRDMTIQQFGFTKKDYMRYKHRLADRIMDRVFHEE